MYFFVVIGILIPLCVNIAVNSVIHYKAGTGNLFGFKVVVSLFTFLHIFVIVSAANSFAQSLR